MMKETLKDQYLLPECRVLEVALNQSILALSQPDGDGEGVTWGGGY